MNVNEGNTLAALIRNRRPLEIPVAVGIVARASRLYAVRGYLGLITPERIVFTRDGDVKIVDTLAPSPNMGYLPLELLEAANKLQPPEAIDWGPAAVFVFGCILWELLVGEPLFTADNHTQALQRARTAEVPVLLDVPSTLDVIVRKAIAKSSESRYSSPGQLATALEEWLVAFEPQA